MILFLVHLGKSTKGPKLQVSTTEVGGNEQEGSREVATEGGREGGTEKARGQGGFSKRTEWKLKWKAKRLKRRELQKRGPEAVGKPAETTAPHKTKNSRSGGRLDKPEREVSLRRKQLPVKFTRVKTDRVQGAGQGGQAGERRGRAGRKRRAEEEEGGGGSGQGGAKRARVERGGEKPRPLHGQKGIAQQTKPLRTRQVLIEFSS